MRDTVDGIDEKGWERAMMSDTKVAKKRQADPDVVRIRQVKDAAAKWEAAKDALTVALAREEGSKAVLFGLIEDAPEAQRAYLRSLAVRSEA